jgi:hypothetical protein
MKKLVGFIVLLAVAMSVTTCNNKLDILAPYREIPSIYAVLNPQEKLQMIRINKIFLGPGNAFDMAKVADSINYKSGELRVSLEHYNNGVKSTFAGIFSNASEIVFRDSIITTVSGAFNSTQRVYVTNERLKTFGTYKLIVKNLNSNSVYSAKSVVVDSVSGAGFPPFSTPYYPIPPGSFNPNDPNNDNVVFINYEKPGAQYSYRIVSIPNAKIYQSLIRIHFQDTTSAGYGAKNYMDYVVGSYEIPDVKAGERVNFSFKGSSLYEGLKTDLSKKPLVSTAGIIGRRPLFVDMICICVSQDYADYLQYSAPSQSVAQDKPLYSNFENGAYGLFAFRSRCQVRKEISPYFVNQIANNSNTCSFKFLASGYNSWNGCP